MYKKAAQLKLRFPSKFGALTAEQLFDIKMADLKKIVTDTFADMTTSTAVMDDLAFLQDVGTTTKEAKEAEAQRLRFNILKDVYTTRIDELQAASEEKSLKQEREHLAAIIAEKKEADLRNMSLEELEAKLKALG